MPNVADWAEITAAAAGVAKLRPADDTPAKVKARLAAEVAKAKTDRESGKKIERPKPAQPADQAGGGKTKAPR